MRRFVVSLCALLFAAGALTACGTDTTQRMLTVEDRTAVAASAAESKTAEHRAIKALLSASLTPVVVRASDKGSVLLFWQCDAGESFEACAEKDTPSTGKMPHIAIPLRDSSDVTSYRLDGWYATAKPDLASSFRCSPRPTLH